MALVYATLDQEATWGGHRFTLAWYPVEYCTLELPTVKLLH